MEDPVFITGLYKNGTSWLLAALSAHPDLVGLRELDVLRSVTRPWPRLTRRAVGTRLRNVFGKSAWCPLRADQLCAAAIRNHLPDTANPASLPDLARRDPDMAVSTLLSLVGKPDAGFVAPGEIDRDRPLGMAQLPRDVLVSGISALAARASGVDILNRFVESFAPLVPDGGRLILKGADQIKWLDSLEKWRPDAPKIVIVRDGRDAAVSAFHYRSLMWDERMAWQHSRWEYSRPAAAFRRVLLGAVVNVREAFGYGADWRLRRSMMVWRDRVRKAMRAGKHGKVYILRYEDLLSHFESTLTDLLVWLDVRVSPDIVANIQRLTAFEALTGREPGKSAKSIMRKGVAGAWRSELTDKDADLCWKIAGRELEKLGYTYEGDVVPLELGILGNT